MDDPAPILAEESRHCQLWHAANADQSLRKAAHCFDAPPLVQFARGCADNPVWCQAANTINARRTVVSFSTRRSSFDLWASLGQLENLLSDYRRLSPRFSFLQLAGEAGIAAGNEYQFTITDPDRLAALRDACRQLAPDQVCGDTRAMDIRVARAGPWGGETGELVVEALENHALAGGSSLWLVAHGEAADESLRITLDAFEICRWAWAPDFIAHRDSRGTTGNACIVDWHYLLERLIQDLDGTPEPVEQDLSFDISIPPGSRGTEVQIAEALRSHSGLVSIVSQIQDQEPISP